MISPSDEQRIKSVSVVEVIRRHLSLKKEGTVFKACCPFHSENTPSFVVNPTRQIYKCFGCNVGGDSVSFIMKHFSLSYPDALRKIAQDHNIYISEDSGVPPKPVRETTKTYRKPIEVSSLGEYSIEPNAAAWFAGRGISFETLKHFGITYRKAWMPPARNADGVKQDRNSVHTVQFPYYRDGELVNIKYRTVDKSFRFEANAELLPYNIDRIKDAPYCVITEGEMDALTIHEAGEPFVVSVPNGGGAKSEYLNNYIEDYFDNKEYIILAVDADKAGVLLRDELIRRLGAERCRVMMYGDECKDVNEYLLKYGAATTLSQLRAAPYVQVDGIFDVDDVSEELDDLYHNGRESGITVGLGIFDNLISFETKRLMTVTGDSTHGKSEFIDEMAVLLSLNHGWKAAYFSPENSTIEGHVSKLTERITGVRFNKRDLPYNEYIECKEYINDNFYFIKPETDFTIDTILDKARTLIRRKGIKVLVLDPYNRFETTRAKGEAPLEYISSFLNKLIFFAKKHGIFIILAVHPTKAYMDLKTHKMRKCTIHHAAGSGDFLNKSDYCITVHREFAPNNWSEVIVEKVKDSWMGEKGTAYFKFNVNNRRYTPISDPALTPIGTEPIWCNENALRRDKLKALNNNSQQSFAFTSDVEQEIANEWDNVGRPAPF
jgi:twinkle protein